MFHKVILRHYPERESTGIDPDDAHRHVKTTFPPFEITSGGSSEHAAPLLA